jgi:hypothetical protein
MIEIQLAASLHHFEPVPQANDSKKERTKRRAEKHSLPDIDASINLGLKCLKYSKTVKVKLIRNFIVALKSNDFIKAS